MNIIKIQYFIFNSLNYINLVNFRDQSCVSDIISEWGKFIPMAGVVHR